MNVEQSLRRLRLEAESDMRSDAVRVLAMAHGDQWRYVLMLFSMTAVVAAAMIAAILIRKPPPPGPVTVQVIAIPNPPANPLGWNNSAVTVGFECRPRIGGCPDPTTISDDGDHLITNAWGRDSKLYGLAHAIEVKIDNTPPSTVLADPALTKRWHNKPVQVRWSCLDELSGPANPSITSAITIADRPERIAATDACADNAGNTAPVPVASIRFDRSTPRPVLIYPKQPAAYYNRDVRFVWRCDEPRTQSGAVTRTVSGWASGEGVRRSAHATCRDRAGNSRPVTEFANIDKTAPVVTIERENAPLLGGQDAIRVSATDYLSGVSRIVVDVIGQDDTVSFATSTSCSPACSRQSMRVTLPECRSTERVLAYAVDVAGNRSDVGDVYSTTLSVQTAKCLLASLNVKRSTRPYTAVLVRPIGSKIGVGIGSASEPRRRLWRGLLR